VDKVKGIKKTHHVGFNNGTLDLPIKLIVTCGTYENVFVQIFFGIIWKDNTSLVANGSLAQVAHHKFATVYT